MRERMHCQGNWPGGLLGDQTRQLSCGLQQSAKNGCSWPCMSHGTKRAVWNVSNFHTCPSRDTHVHVHHVCAVLICLTVDRHICEKHRAARSQETSQLFQNTWGKICRRGGLRVPWPGLLFEHFMAGRLCSCWSHSLPISEFLPRLKIHGERLSWGDQWAVKAEEPPSWQGDCKGKLAARSGSLEFSEFCLTMNHLDPTSLWDHSNLGRKGERDLSNCKKWNEI